MSTADSDRKRPLPSNGDGGGGKRPAVAAAASESEDANTCWLCLDAVHESGVPLRRDCSCRGSSGFAHLPCIVGYAKDWSQKHERANFPTFSEKWCTCRNCDMPHKNGLAIDLIDELIAFVKAKYAGNRMKHLGALSCKLEFTEEVESVKDICIEMLSSIIEYLTIEAPAHVPWTIKFMEARAYSRLGSVYFGLGTKEGWKNAVKYFRKSLVLQRDHDIMPIDIFSEVAVQLAQAKAKYEGSVFKLSEMMLEGLRRTYKARAKDQGREAVAGLNYAYGLKFLCRGIEAERLLTELAATCKQVHGTGHEHTESVCSFLFQCKERIVEAKIQGGEVKRFQALRYGEDGRLVLQGPIATPRNVQAEQVMREPEIGVDFAGGTPVVCTGMTERSHLNGKIGDVRGWEEESKCCEVHFEGGGPPEKIEKKSLRVVFDLPAPDVLERSDASVCSIDDDQWREDYLRELLR